MYSIQNNIQNLNISEQRESRNCMAATPALRSLMRGEIVSVYQLSKTYYKDEMCLICV